MTGPLTRLGRYVAALALVTLAAFLAPVPQASAAPADSVPAYLGCLLGQRHGDLLILFDTTGSLRTTDPGRLRADAAKALVAELASFAKANSVQLDGAIAGFDAAYAQEGGWSPLTDPAGAGELTSRIDTVSSRTDGFETDLWTALDGARRALQDKAQQSRRPTDPPGSKACQAMLWFTDGEFHLATRTNAVQQRQYDLVKPYAPDLQLSTDANAAAATTRGEASMCRSGGPADQLRAGNVVIWSIGLKPPGSTADLSLLQRVAEGQDGAGVSCGTLRSPPGSYIAVTDVSQLVTEIWTLAHPGAQHLQRFVLDDALSQVSIAAHQSSGQGLRIVGPASIGSVDIPYRAKGAGTAQFGSSGVVAGWRWDSPDSLSVDVTRGGQSWLGVWSINTLDGRPANPDSLQVSFRGDLLPAWPADNQLIAGRTNAVHLAVTRQGSAVSPGEIPGTISLGAELQPQTGSPLPIAGGLTKQTMGNAESLALPDTVAGPASVRLRLGYTTQRVAGLTTTLADQIVIVPVQIQPPSGQVTGTFDFGAIHGRADTGARVSVEGPTCVWLPGAGPHVVAVPEQVDSGAVRITSEHDSPEHCLRVDAHTSADLSAMLTTASGGNGALSGSVTLNLAPENDPSRPVPVQVAFRAEMDQPVNLPVTVGVFLAVFVLGIGVPIALLYVFKWRGAMIPGHPLEAVRVPVTVTDGEVRHQGRPLTGGNLPAPSAVDLRKQGTRTTTAAGVQLRTRMGVSPFGAGFVEASLPGHVGASSAHEAPQGKVRAARLPLALHNTWAVFHDPVGAPENATVLVLRGFDLDAQGSDALLADARSRIPGLMSSLGTAGAGVGDAGLGDSAMAQPQASGDFGLTGAGLASPPQPVPREHLDAQEADESRSQSASPAEESSASEPPEADAAPDWGSQTFGTFGLGGDSGDEGTHGTGTNERHAR